MNIDGWSDIISVLEKEIVHMDELFKLLAEKVNYVAIVILGFIVPGNVLIFVWNQDLYFEIDIIRLLVLSFGIAFIVYVPNFILTALFVAVKSILTESDKEQKNNEDEQQNRNMTELISVIIVPIVLEFCEIGAYIYSKIVSSNTSISGYCKYIGEYLIPIIGIFFALYIIVSIASPLILKVRNKLKEFGKSK